MMVNLIRTLHLTYRPPLVFSLCVECNQVLRPVAYELAEHRVVPKIYAMYKEFTECPVCKKVFWGFDGDRVVNYKSFRTLELLRSLCLSAGAALPPSRTSLLSLRSFRSFPRSVKSCILAYLSAEDLGVFGHVFPVLAELIADVRHFQETGEPVKTFSEIKQCRRPKR
ncbi:hypothetical protein STCU_09720 [Strigomonas culicis]|nr:hypothetical protein STCU_09720 [Strigomonas culicis]|eukprot:EPY18892.1 hypothetical protein STCU_09720 [Strigomonas culicis]